MVFFVGHLFRKDLKGCRRSLWQMLAAMFHPMTDEKLILTEIILSDPKFQYHLSRSPLVLSLLLLRIYGLHKILQLSAGGHTQFPV